MTMNPFFGNQQSIFNLIHDEYVPPIDENVDAQITQISGPILLNGDSSNNEIEFVCNNSEFVPVRFIILNEHDEMLYYKVSKNGLFIIDGHDFMMNSIINFKIKAASDNMRTFSKKQIFSYQIVPDNIMEPSGSIEIDTNQISIVLQQPSKFYKEDFTGYDTDSIPVGTHVKTAYRIMDSSERILYRTESTVDLYSHVVPVSELNLSKSTSIKVYAYYIDSYGLWSLRSQIGTGVIEV